ncbi:MFS general substrate transporter [Penicillium longicatenatum]|uniref:MFS general substrate transporter n=1 Tax=Penicillium longicatenatum TaxID=1561947 RepID=UPI002546D127|nr:MFS general substrate transporter [Penicillium longicatenatum]KAJ5630785.1 MFS general substrate transporter [Penicillium longicatenatum]
MDGPEPAPERHHFEPKRKLTGIKDGTYHALLNLVTVNTLELERPTCLSLTGMVWGLGTVLGPMVGGAFELYSWRWAFYINLLFGAIILPALVSIIPSNHLVPGVSTRHKLATFDWLGTILSIVGGGTIIALFIVSGVLSNDYLMSKFGWYKPWYVCGAIIALVGTVLMSRLKVETSNSEVYGYQTLIGLGAGSFAQAGFAVIQATLSGLAIGLSVTGALFTNLAKINLQTVFPNVDESTLISIAAGTGGGILEMQSEAKPNQALIAIVDALHDVLIEVYVVAGLAVILSVFLKWKKVYIEGSAGGMW